MAEIEHVALRPSWNCRACGYPWPCVPAKRQLTAELSPTQLAIRGWGDLEEAAQDLPTMSVKAAFVRFVEWTWPEKAAQHEVFPE